VKHAPESSTCGTRGQQAKLGLRRASLILLLLLGCLWCTPAPQAADTDLPPASSGLSSPTPPTATAPVPVPEASPKALRYYRGNMILWGVNTLLGFLIPIVLLATGLSGRFRDGARRVGRRWFFVIAVYFALFSLFLALVQLPLDFYSGYLREHAYGLSNQTLGKWFGDAAKGLLITILVGPLVLWLPYLLLRRAPRSWWLISGLLALPLLILMIFVTPLWIAPLFNDFGPMKDKALEREILSLADRAGIEGSRVFEVNKSVDTKALNAYVTGFRDTKRIVLWDTLIAALDREETLFVMGHEMGHYVLNHVWQLLIVYSCVILLTLYAAHRIAPPILARYGNRFRFTELHDIASLPLLLLFLQATTFVLTPPLNAFSRHLERQCDRFGIEITRNPVAAATAFVKLQQENLGNPRPGWVYRIWLASHPPLGDRIDFCNSYHPWTKDRPLKFESRFRTRKTAP